MQQEPVPALRGGRRLDLRPAGPRWQARLRRPKECFFRSPWQCGVVRRPAAGAVDRRELCARSSARSRHRRLLTARRRRRCGSKRCHHASVADRLRGAAGAVRGRAMRVYLFVGLGSRGVRHVDVQADAAIVVVPRPGSHVPALWRGSRRRLLTDNPRALVTITTRPRARSSSTTGSRRSPPIRGFRPGPEAPSPGSGRRGRRARRRLRQADADAAAPLRELGGTAGVSVAARDADRSARHHREVTLVRFEREAIHACARARRPPISAVAAI